MTERSTAGTSDTDQVTEASGVTSLEAFLAPWTALRAAVREILAGQPSPHLVRTTARRIAGEIHLTADSVVKALEAREERP
ncbi:hypothetical protein ACIQCF_30110 [Streptomyces sp. NPDC088353]|uniref:hypothetical protein n=1 Tax=Streptomyces sp. NPDC088353 TaxID=3365855 RepID=UPI0038012D50